MKVFTSPPRGVTLRALGLVVEGLPEPPAAACWEVVELPLKPHPIATPEATRMNAESTAASAARPRRGGGGPPGPAGAAGSPGGGGAGNQEEDGGAWGGLGGPCPTPLGPGCYLRAGL